MENELFSIGQLVEKVCKTCELEQSHKVSALTKKGQISKVICSVCGTASTFKSGVKTTEESNAPQEGLPYDRACTYRKGQTMMHATFGYGVVMSVIEPQKIDVKFADGLRRMIHARN